MSTPIRLGLIGDNIARSRSPALHRIAGRLNGLSVSYDLFIPRDMGLDFQAVFERCRAEGLRGVNVTYPYKEQAAALIEIEDERTRRMGAVNTIVFENGRALGYNTDFTGFMAAYRSVRGDARPGRVALVGAGGVGRAVAFGLLSLGVDTIAIADLDAGRAHGLAQAVEAAGGKVEVCGNLEDAVRGASGIINCTPIGMVGYPGTPVPAPLLASAEWAFDAVYTPVETTFKRDAEAAGMVVISGYELFFNQGIHAFEIFTGRAPADLETLRRNLSDGHDN